MRRFAPLSLAMICATAASASTIQIAITGTTSAVYVDEGPILGYSSYSKVPDGTAFILTYTFEDTKGTENILGVNSNVIIESGIETSASSAPGTNATLQIGNGTWEFGAATRSEARLNTSSTSKRYQFTYATPARDNHISATIRPATGSYWPTNADWRASFTATSLTNSTGSFSADNGRVSAKGDLIPSTLTVSGINVSEQWLSYTTIAGGPAASGWTRRWHLAHRPLKDGYIVQQVTRITTGSRSAETSTSTSRVQYWEAWQVTTGSASTTVEEMDRLTNAPPAGLSGTETISATARFYEGLSLPANFAPGRSPDASSRLSSTEDPHLPTDHATLPVHTEATLHF